MGEMPLRFVRTIAARHGRGRCFRCDVRFAAGDQIGVWTRVGDAGLTLTCGPCTPTTSRDTLHCASCLARLRARPGRVDTGASRVRYVPEPPVCPEGCDDA